MGVSLRKGQKVDLTKGNPYLSSLLVGLGWDTNRYAGGNEFDLDAAAFLLGADGKVADDSDFIFYGNLRHASGAVEHLGDNLVGGSKGDDEQIVVDLDKVPAKVEKIAFTVTIYEADVRKQNFGQVNNSYIHIVEKNTNTEVIRYELGEDFSVETALVVGELYRYKGEWKFNAIGSGFQGGLKALCKNYGLNMEERRSVELKKGQKVNLQKRGNAMGEILINLNWSTPETRKGFLSGGGQAIDLDLGCLYELRNGRKGCVQALGNSFGSLSVPPYVALDGDDRTGSSEGGENLRVNGSMVSELKRLLIYTFIYEGAANWREANGVVTVKCQGSQDVIVRMDEYGIEKHMCAIAMLENYKNETFSVEKIVRFFDGHKAMDEAFGWGLRWVPGRK